MKRAHVFVSVLAFTGAVSASVFTSSSAHAQLAPPSLFGRPAAPFGTARPAPVLAEARNQGEGEGSGRRHRLVYVNADVGCGALLDGFRRGGLPYFGFGASAGVRLSTFTLGARVRDQLGSVNILAIGGEAAYHLVLGSADLVLGAHGGYARRTNTGGESLGNVGLDAGLDFYLSSTFSIGGSVSPDVYFNGGAAGVGLFVGPRIGLHFGP